MKLKRIALWTVIAIPVVILAAGGIAYSRSTNSCYSGPQVAPTHPMKAATYCDFGSSDVLRMSDVEKPVPGDSQVLVRVHAVAVNPLDWHMMEGTPYIGRLSFGLRKPSSTRMGVDFAGTVEAVGKSVTKFKVGDDVFGGRNGAFAEYVTARENGSIALKPANMSFEQAASVPIAAVTALQAVRDRAKVHAGQRVLINGASGGVGTFMVQIAKSYGAHVTGVCSGRHVEMVKSIGADDVIDYTKADYTKGTERYDVIIDNVGNRSLSENRSVLVPAGAYVQVGGGGLNDGKWLGPLGRLVTAMVYSKFVSQHMGMMLASLEQSDLNVLADMMRSGKLTPVIDRKYAFKDLPEAMTYLEGGHAAGKVVVTIE